MNRLAITALVLATAASAFALQPTTKPAAEAKPVRLVKPWSGLATLTPEQKDQIAKLHRDATDEMNKIRDKEEADIMALLTPEQKKELEAMKAKERADDKAKAAEKKKIEGEAPKPQ